MCVYFLLLFLFSCPSRPGSPPTSLLIHSSARYSGCRRRRGHGEGPPITARPASFSSGHARNVPTVWSRRADGTAYSIGLSSLCWVLYVHACVCACVVCAGEMLNHTFHKYPTVLRRPHISTSQPAPVSSSLSCWSSSELEQEMQLTGMQLGRAGAEAESTEASSSPTNPRRRPCVPRQGLPCATVFRVVSSRGAALPTQRATRGPSSREVLPCHAPGSGGVRSCIPKVKNNLEETRRKEGRVLSLGFDHWVDK